MKAVVNDKKNLTFVSHLNGVTIVESSGFIIDLDYQCLTSICEIFDIGNNYSIVESNRISELENALTESEADVANKSTQISKLSSELNLRARVISKKNEEIEQLKSDIIKYNVDSMNIYFVESNTPNVVRKFHDESFSITCKDSYTAEIINILLNCGFDISGIMTVYKLYIVSSNIN